MKIRMRNRLSHELLEVIEESPSYYIVSSDGDYICLSKNYYEPVPAEQWEDVTAQCELEWNGNRLTYPGGDPLAIVIDFPKNYRLFRVQGFVQQAFIVERRKS